MARPKLVGDIQVDEDLAFQRRSWQIQRVGWAIMALLILAALLGLFGPGPLSYATAGVQGSSLWVEYNRFVRFTSVQELIVHLGPEAVRGDEAPLWFSTTYIESLDIQGITPQPDAVEIGPDRITYVFLVDNPSEPFSVYFVIQPEKIGLLEAQIGVDEGELVRFRQFVYP